jgi:Protein of unknown function (DUF3603)
MLYLHDVWANWFESEENGYNVCEFHEWRKTDTVELIDQVPLLKVNTRLFNYILDNLDEIPQEILDAVFQKGFYRKNHERVMCDYMFVITDGKDTLAVDTIGYIIPVRKSRLVPRQHELALEMVNDGRKNDFTITKKEIKKEKEYNILSLHPKNMYGLTRKEKQLKQLLMMGLDQVYKSENLDKMKYFYCVFENVKFSSLKDLSLDELFDLFYSKLENGWSKESEELCKIIVSTEPYLNTLYEMETAI